MAECPRCGGEVREGEVLVRVLTLGAQVMSPLSSLGTLGMPGMGIPSGETKSEEKIIWREKTGRKTGWLAKSDEEKNMKITGRRCIKCGYIELYAQE